MSGIPGPPFRNANDNFNRCLPGQNKAAFTLLMTPAQQQQLSYNQSGICCHAKLFLCFLLLLLLQPVRCTRDVAKSSRPPLIHSWTSALFFFSPLSSLFSSTSSTQRAEVARHWNSAFPAVLFATSLLPEREETSFVPRAPGDRARHLFNEAPVLRSGGVRGK